MTRRPFRTPHHTVSPVALVGGGSNPQPGEIPCHRVVFQDGSLCGGFAFGGEGAQRALLADEGVVFLPDGRVDLQKCAWLGAPRARE